MKDTMKQVIILNNFSLPEIQQAIIILRNPVLQDETRIVMEAERVIEGYLSRRRKKENRPAGAVLLAAVMLGIAVTALAVYGAVALIAG